MHVVNYLGGARAHSYRKERTDFRRDSNLKRGAQPEGRRLGAILIGASLMILLILLNSFSYSRICSSLNSIYSVLIY